MTDYLFDLWITTNVFLIMTLALRERPWYSVAIGKIALAIGMGAFLVLAGIIATLRELPLTYTFLYLLWAAVASYFSGKLLLEGVKQLAVLILYHGFNDEAVEHWREHEFTFSRDDVATFRLTAIRKIADGRAVTLIRRW